MRGALLGLALALVALLWGWSRLMQVVVDAKAAGTSSDALDLARTDPLGFAAFVLGLLASFVCTLLTALSFLHARHVERALSAGDSRRGEPA